MEEVVTKLDEIHDSLYWILGVTSACMGLLIGLVMGQR